MLHDPPEHEDEIPIRIVFEGTISTYDRDNLFGVLERLATQFERDTGLTMPDGVEFLDRDRSRFDVYEDTRIRMEREAASEAPALAPIVIDLTDNPARAEMQRRVERGLSELQVRTATERGDAA